MIIQFVSDLHIDLDLFHTDNYIKQKGDILILAGDICSFYNLFLLRTFIKKVYKNYKYVLYIPGNQEYYYYDFISFRSRRTMDQLFNNALSLEKEFDNLYFLNRNSVIINNICITGCTLWSKSTLNQLPKYVKIHNLSIEEYNKSHAEDLLYINDMEKYCQQQNIKHIIITHHSPLDSDLVNKKYSSLYYSNVDISNFKMVSHWIFGHTHINMNIKKNNINFITNQYRNTSDYKNYSSIVV